MSSRRPRRALRALIVILLIVAGLGVAADRIGESFAEDRLATAAADEAAQYDVRAADTSVEIGGFGFLPQVARSEFDQVTMTMKEPTIEKVAAEDLTVQMHKIHVPRELLTGGTGAAVTVEKADLRLRLSPAALAKLTANTRGIDALTLQIVGGKLLAKATIQGIDVSATVRPEARDGRIGLVADQSTLEEIPEALRGAVSAVLARGIVVPELPFKATIQQVAIEGQSVVLTAVASNLELSA
ncbi:DUF2993 domain-containing protein [Streptomyces sp. SID13031]|uniref:LmeA family phospholipid-binding protein n=1 Tax=Streptomyces sp. SID13031 TaxID=2706046 RepID=UPI0013C8509F|nr:DUF2993 domain-containing protein [Streptomyces sp. SID13031]NEA37315.1 DUF2993 domain-containing protein [Streptomyces sp. SID13031]